jgi:EAL domain-containing protein (putative c-di-GMP-specific phosphodiesterase class I)
MTAPLLAPHAHETIQRLLHRTRTHLGLDVAFVSELTGDARLFRYVDAEGLDAPIRVGDWDAREESYCHYVASGALPELIRDATQHPVAAEMAATAQIPIGTHVGVPIVLADDTVYGTFCAFATGVKEAVDESDLSGVRLMADLVATYIDEARVDAREAEQRRQRLRAVVASDDLAIVGQPIMSLATGEVVGVEALARFPTLGRGPADVFDEAWQLGIGAELELAAVDAAIDRLGALADDVYLAVNAAPGVLGDPAFAQRAAALAPKRLVVEITEHAVVVDDEAFLVASKELSGHGVGMAIDDVGTGFSSLTRLLQVVPDILKIDKSLVADVEASPARQTLIAGLERFAQRLGVTTVVEGVETASQAAVLRWLGIAYGQGFFLAPPCEPAELDLGRVPRR